jgi:hypothetical protein
MIEKLTVSCINANSFNISTSNDQKFLKVEGITGGGCDIILITDCRMGIHHREIEQMFRMVGNGGYMLYSNINSEKRGTVVAVKRSSQIVVNECFNIGNNRDATFLKVKRGNFEFLVGAIYGPNENNVNFFQGICDTVTREGLPFILGGDFNTILDQRRGRDNLDKEGGGGIPNCLNSDFLNLKINENVWTDPFRILYPENFRTYHLEARIMKWIRIDWISF